MKQMYRVVIYFTDDQFKSTRPSNIFLRADNEKHAIDFCIKAFKAQLLQTGIPDANFKVEIFPSSEEEATQYQKERSLGHKTSKAVN